MIRCSCYVVFFSLLLIPASFAEDGGTDVRGGVFAEDDVNSDMFEESGGEDSAVPLSSGAKREFPRAQSAGERSAEQKAVYDALRATVGQRDANSIQTIGEGIRNIGELIGIKQDRINPDNTDEPAE